MRHRGLCFGLLLFFAFSMAGCSSLSEWYACGVGCQYCPRPPLPFQQYPDGICHSHVVSRPRQTLEQRPEAATGDPGGEADKVNAN